MNAENTVPYDCSNGKIIECIADGFPEFDIKFAFDFIVKSINFINFRTFVISSQYKKVVWVLNFVCHQQAKAL